MAATRERDATARGPAGRFGDEFVAAMADALVNDGLPASIIRAER